jgi:hypothetical protein
MHATLAIRAIVELTTLCRISLMVSWESAKRWAPDVREPLPQTLLHPSVSPWSAFDLDLCASKSYDAASVAASLERTIGCNTTSKR